MTARGVVDTGAACLPIGSDTFASDAAGTVTKPWAMSLRQLLVVLFLISSDVLLASAA